MKFILASKSLRRREILSSLGLNFDIITSEADESSPETNPERLVMTLAERKGKAVVDKLIGEGRDLTDTLIIACDTLVHFDGNILGKPQDRADAKKMLSMLSGKSHFVSSGDIGHEGYLLSFDRDHSTFRKRTDGNSHIVHRIDFKIFFHRKFYKR